MSAARSTRILPARAASQQKCCRIFPTAFRGTSTKSVFDLPVSQMLKSSGAMAGATMTSRLLGVVREVVYAAFMGNTWIASAFQLAFSVPNLFRRLLGEGALTAAFIPIFKQKEINEGEAEMWRAANAVISGLVVAAGAITVLGVLGISLALRFHAFERRTELMLELL